MRNFLIASNLWVALAAGAFTLLSFQFLFSAVALAYAALVAFATAGGYSYMRLVQWYQQSLRQKTQSHTWWQASPIPALLLTFIYAFGTSWFFMVAIPPHLRWYLIPPVMVAGLYPIAFPYPLHSFTSLRTLPGLKLFLISACWTYITYIIPLLLQAAPFGMVEATEAFFRFLFIAAITIPFDVRDYSTDKPQLRTLPQVLGPKQALVWACFGIGLYQFWLTVRLLFLALPFSTYVGWIAGLELGYWLVKRAGNHRSDAYISFWVEGIPLFILLLVWLAQAIFVYL